MSIYSLLHEDHVKVAKLFDELEQLKGERDNENFKKEAETLFMTIKNELLRHSEAEEEVFYKPLEAKKKTHDSIMHAEDEHSNMEELMTELSTDAKYDSRWFVKLAKLKKMVAHHVEEEETKIFKDAEKIFSEEDEIKIEHKFKENKEMLANQ